MINSKMLGVIVIMFLVLNMGVFIYTQSTISNLTPSIIAGTAYASGTAAFCINQPPYGLINNCNFVIPWGFNYSCNSFAASDNNPNTVFSYSSIFPNNDTLFNISANGTINFNPPKSAIGNHTVRIFVYDNSPCIDNYYFQDYNVSIYHKNHPPYLASFIPDGVMLNGTNNNYYLNDFFKDPDNDNLTYLFVPLTAGIASVTIDNNSLVTIKGNSCGDFKVFFIATDPYNLTATSNLVKYSVLGCPAPPVGSSSGGSGGGGGGYNQLCTPNWRCGSWSDCSPTNKSTLECQDYSVCDPNDYMQFFEKNCTYVPEVYNCLENWNCTDWSPCINNTHSRSCLDLNSCGTNTTFAFISSELYYGLYMF